MDDLNDVLIKVDADMQPFHSNLSETLRGAEDAGSKFGRSFNDGFEKSLKQSAGRSGGGLMNSLLGGSFGGSIEGMASSFHTTMTNALLRNAVFNPMKNMLFGGLFGRATGGAVNGQQPYMVGEHGPEVFVPEGKGRIEPRSKGQNSGASASPTHITINVTTPSSDQFKESQSQVMGEMARHLERTMLYR